jgi:hypothetical protein
MLRMTRWYAQWRGSYVEHTRVAQKDNMMALLKKTTIMEALRGPAPGQVGLDVRKVC